MNKVDFVKAVAKRAGITNKEAAALTTAVLDEIMESIKHNEELTFTGFGTFGKRLVPPREGSINGVRFKTKAHQVPTFHPGKNFRDAVN